MKCDIIKRAMVNRGNWHLLQGCMQKAKRGERLTIAFLGGSITQGSLSSEPEKCYAYLVYLWWKETFPQTEMRYLNAGVGGTTSQYGVARVNDDVLSCEPDVVIVEFSVNDDSNSFFEEIYEGMIRNLVKAKSQPALVILNNVYYNTGINAQEYHNRIGRAYQIPCISMKNSIYEMVQRKEIEESEITSDHLHPNDLGHQWIAEVITGFFDIVYCEINNIEEPAFFPASPVTKNQYEISIRYQNDAKQVIADGFVADKSKQEGITDVFKKGWTASDKKDSIAFLVNGSGIAIQYRKSIKQPTPIAKAIVDGDIQNAVILDGNFNEDWGDCLYLETILYHGEEKEHEVKIEIIEASEEDEVPFYLVAVIASR